MVQTRSRLLMIPGGAVLLEPLDADSAGGAKGVAFLFLSSFGDFLTIYVSNKKYNNMLYKC